MFFSFCFFLRFLSFELGIILFYDDIELLRNSKGEI